MARPLLHVGAHPVAADLGAQLRSRDWEVTHARSLKAALPLLRHGAFRVALFTPAGLARETAADFEACREANDACEWVAVLPPGALDHAPTRELTLRHFFDHHTNPADPVFLCQSLGHAYGRALLRGATPAAHALEGDMGMVGRSPAMNQLRRVIRKAAGTNACVLIEGESGSGKEMAARALHAASSSAGGPFVAINCGSLAGEPPDRFEEAAGGTLFLDHVADMPLDWQARLVRFLAERSVIRTKLGRDDPRDVRVVAATETPLEGSCAAKRFRQDLYYRLNVVPLAVPPLRQRKDDIPLLAQHFHARCVRAAGGSATGFSRQALAALREHAWPGNVRELANRVERAVLLAEKRLIGAQDLGFDAGPPLQPIDSLESIRVQAERDAIALSLDRFSHNVSLAARELGVSRMTMYRLMAKHAIAPRAS